MDGDGIPLISQHPGWLSVDPIIGCPASCSYCYLGPLHLTRKRPQRRSEPKDIYDLLVQSPLFHKDKIFGLKHSWPICFGNQTDLCLTASNREFCVALLSEHARRLPRVPVCIVTKALLTDKFLEGLNDLGISITFAISVSFLRPVFERGIPSIEGRLANFRKICQYENIRTFHYWRPLTSIDAPSEEIIARRIDQLKAAGSCASQITGLAYGPGVAQMLLRETNPWFAFARSQISESLGNTTGVVFERDLLAAVLRLAKERSYPVFLKASCANSFANEISDYAGSYREKYRWKCATSCCPSKQRARCQAAAIEKHIRKITPDSVASFLDISPKEVSIDYDLGLIRIGESVEQGNMYCLEHASSYGVLPESVERTMEWYVPEPKKSEMN